MNFDSYNPGNFYDEFFDVSGTPRPEVRQLIERINSFPKRELVNRQKAAESAFMQMGITFGVYGDQKGLEKIFPFDVIPRIIQAREWDLIDRGVKQRVHALNLFIQDIYNDQKILKDGVISRELILSSAAYRKECLGLNPPKGIWCHISGIDLVRDENGQFYVLEDNLRCPSGVSYVLGNRRVMKQTLPAIFDSLPIRPVDDYTSRLSDTLRHLIPESIMRPNIVILTPGIHNSAYFEHSFLAQQMGEELVEGQDLVVMDDFVYMRTTKGFERVDAIYRRVDDEFLDPTVFNPDSLLGVPGLMKSYRAGKVALANAPGAGIADDKAIYSFVPEIIKYYTGEDAIIPNVPTFVCEDEKQRQHVIDNIANFVVKTTHGSGGYGMLIGPFSTKEQQAQMVENIRREPRNYIGQPVIQLSRVPVVVKDHFEGRHIDLRPYVLYGEDIYVLPGGLTRVALEKGSLVVNSSQGGGAKTPGFLRTTLFKITQAKIMLSRVANSIFWMNRYLERAENIARLIETQLHMILDLPSLREDPAAWKPLVDITGDGDYFTEKLGAPTRENVMFFHTFDSAYPHSIKSCLTAARENARSVREVIPSEIWEMINRLYLEVAGMGTSFKAFKNPHKFYSDIKMTSHLIMGIAYTTMSRGEGWHFAQLGRYLERADKTSRILDVKYFIILPQLDYVGSSMDNVQWSALLKSTSSFEMYRKRFNLISPENIVDFLVFDREFPRSILYSVNHAEQSLFNIMGGPTRTSNNELERQFGKLAGKLNYSNVSEAMSIGLHGFLDGVQSDLNHLDEAIHENFFAIKKVTDATHYGYQNQWQG